MASSQSSDSMFQDATNETIHEKLESILSRTKNRDSRGTDFADYLHQAASYIENQKQRKELLLRNYVI